MPKFAADYSVALEIHQPLLNIILAKLVAYLSSQNQHQYTTSLGFFGRLQATLKDITITDIEDTPPVGGVVTDVAAVVDVDFRLFNFIPLRMQAVLSIIDVEVDLTTTPAGLPRGIAFRVTPSMAVNIRFQGGILAWLFNLIVSPLVRFGVWLAFRIIRDVEIPVWQIVDVFAVLGIRYAPGSPLLTAYKATPPASLLLAADFNLTDPLRGTPNQLARFSPANTNIGAVVHERIIAAALQIAFMKGWVPQMFRAGGFKIYINYIRVRFEQDTVVATGRLKAKRGKCWCRVKVRIEFRVAVKPRMIDTNTPDPKIYFEYDADLNIHISTSGMLVVLGTIMFAPLFLALTITLSFLINLVLKNFLPFRTSFSQSGLTLTVQAIPAFSGFVPLSMTFPLQLNGTGTYSLGRFTQFQLPGGGNVDASYTPESLSVQDKELRVAVGLS